MSHIDTLSFSRLRELLLPPIRIICPIKHELPCSDEGSFSFLFFFLHEKF